MKTMFEELVSLRRIVDLQRVELQRQRRQMELSVRRTADLQGQVDRLQHFVERSEQVRLEVKGPARSIAPKRARAN